MIERISQRTNARGRARNRVRTGAADVVLVLGNIGQMRKMAERADDLNGLRGR